MCRYYQSTNHATNLVKGAAALVRVIVPDLFFVVAPHLVAEVVIFPTGVRVYIPFLETQNTFHTNLTKTCAPIKEKSGA